jgi:hypothetical protein
MTTDGDDAPGVPTCAICGHTDDSGLGWMLEQDRRRGPIRVCPRCQRDHLRAIEAKLPREWW